MARWSRRSSREWVAGPERRRRVAAATLAAALLGATACRDATAPLPQGSWRVAASESYTVWWQEVESCSGLTGDLARIAWHEVPADSAYGGFWCEDAPDNECAGEWVSPHDIYLAGPSALMPEGYVADAWTVKHEMLHDLVGRPGHPQVFADCRLDSRTPAGVFGLYR